MDIKINPMIRRLLALIGIRFVITLMFGMLSSGLQGQNFNKENKPKTLSVFVGLGAGTFYAAPRPFTDSLVDQMMPVASLGLEKRLGGHFSVKSQVGFQAFGNKEYSISEEIVKPLYRGISYAWEFTPTFNLMPDHHHLNRSKMDFTLGVGIGYLANYTAEKFIFQNKEYTFNFLDHSAYIPIRSSIIFRIDSWSDLAVEGVFFHTFLEEGSSISSFNQYGDHFAQVNLVYRRLIN
jgi:ABC-type antimicrobial peptide transport system permease subunit